MLIFWNGGSSKNCNTTRSNLKSPFLSSLNFNFFPFNTYTASGIILPCLFTTWSSTYCCYRSSTSLVTREEIRAVAGVRRCSHSISAFPVSPVQTVVRTAAFWFLVLCGPNSFLPSQQFQSSFLQFSHSFLAGSERF